MSNSISSNSSSTVGVLVDSLMDRNTVVDTCLQASGSIPSMWKESTLGMISPSKRFGEREQRSFRVEQNKVIDSESPEKDEGNYMLKHLPKREATSSSEVEE
ncbi:hypothetical protein O181_054022 [Austropuccinia psidii MF-1]|uniref:Uncharacterized protein n=1 Tax=Austropuccinia psidii MF-1 TaxID=1389203 RepID=A0A9Q3EAV1_9BASI|nr:hypothetical protein [Austropuccinia psidii MF-1]